MKFYTFLKLTATGDKSPVESRKIRISNFIFKGHNEIVVFIHSELGLFHSFCPVLVDLFSKISNKWGLIPS